MWRKGESDQAGDLVRTWETVGWDSVEKVSTAELMERTDTQQALAFPTH